MKRKLCLGLSAALALSMTACGGGSSQPKMPAFSEEKLTDAQQYVYAAMDSYEIPDREEDFKEAYVMLTDDLAADLKGKVDFTTWDVSEYDAAVVVYLGDQVEEGETVSKDDWSPVVFLLGGESKEVGFSRSLKASSTATEDGAAADAGTIADAKKALAQAQLDAESYLEKNKQKLGDYPALLEAKIAENPDYVYSLEYFADINGKGAEAGFYAGHYRNIYRAEYRLAQLTAENPKDEDLIEEDYLLFDQKFSVLGSIYEIQKTIANLDATAADKMKEYKAALETAKANEDYFFDEAYTRAALANETANSYDVSLRQLEVYETALEAIEQVMASSDEDEREYLEERAALVEDHIANYSNMYKTYVQCLVNLTNFETSNAEALAAYEAAVEAVKESVGDGYEDSVEYIKVQLKYEAVLTDHEAYKNAIPLAKADLDAMKEEFDTALSELDAEEQERLDEEVITQEKNAFFEYACAVTAEVTEYEAVKGQWGSVHPDYAEYQNENLEYYSSYSGGSSSGKSSYSSGSSYSGGSSSRSSGTGAGGYDMPKSGESFSDYVKRVDPDLYDSMTDIYNEATSGY